ncbi:hypothetical protein CVT24_006688 [Panaeolus cyanescens]|uniref:Uncharacterized protein n=1 Tax=Panaeolus cyanescens TaxID=181874 RepID=A0A409YRZ6_9AGAR|nr:hypothetical protein CVT24_006688 [Panaeolus cyanescens]
MDATSLALIALELSDIRKDKEEAFEFFFSHFPSFYYARRAWYQAHVPSATMRLVSHYLPLNANLNLDLIPENPTRGTTSYYLKSIGGSRGLAQLYLEAGLLHLEGAAATLLAASYSSLSSIRMPLHAQIGEGGTEAWRRDREAAGKFFDRARDLCPTLDIPALPAEDEMELEMPILHMPTSAPDSVQSKEESNYAGSEHEGTSIARRRRGKKEDQSLLDKTRANADLDELDNTWYLYVPGLIGAGTALLVVGIVGALSFSTWSRRNQSS